MAVLLVTAAGGAVGVAYTSANDGPSHFFQVYFMPAVTMACGRGFVDVPEEDAPRVAAFLNLRSPRCDCEDLPEDLRDADDPAHFRKYWQSHHRYLLYAVAICFRLFGLSWRSLIPLYGMFCGLTAACVYAFLRLGAGRAVSVVMTLILIVAPIHLEFLPHLRDYSKMPFFVAVWFLMGLLVRRRWKGWQTLLLSALAGAIVGIGLGFREDVLLFVLPFPAVLLFFVPERAAARIGVTAAAILCFFGGLYATGFPNLMAPGTNRWHNVLLGFARPFDENLGVEGSTPYQFEYLYNDSLQVAATNSYANRILGIDRPLPFPSEAYDAAGERRFFEIVRAFPADMAVRALSATRRVLDYSLFCPDSPYPSGLPADAFLGFYDAYRRMFGWLYGRGCCCASLGIFLLIAYRTRWGLYALVFVLFFCGYSCLQFAPRHYFHLIAIPVWFLGFLTQQTIFLVVSASSRIRACGRTREDDPDIAPSIRRYVGLARTAAIAIARPLRLRRAVLLLVVLLLSCAAMLRALFAYQHMHVRSLLDKYAAAELVPVPFTKAMDPENGVAGLRPHGFGKDEEPPPVREHPAIRTEYLVLELDSNAGYVPVTLDFGTNLPYVPFSKDVTVDTRRWTDSPERLAEPARLYFPVYCGFAPEMANVANPTFNGIVIPYKTLPYLRGIYRVVRPNELPLLLHLTLTPGWRDSTLVETPQAAQEPLSVRSRAAARHNLIVNGGFEVWTPPDAARGVRVETLAGFVLPARCSTVSKETETVGQGRFAVRQTWEKADLHESDHLRTMLAKLETGKDYELIVRVLNRSENDVGVSVVRLSDAMRDRPIPGEVVSLIRIGPSRWPRFQEYSTAAFRLDGPDPVCDVQIMTVSVEPSVYPATVFWDEWRLVRVCD